jgi:hypothetical protein
MGMFLSLSGVIGKTQDEVCTCLDSYAKSVGGGLHKKDLSKEDENTSVIAEANGNVSILYPRNYFEWDQSSAFISAALNAPVFSFHVHDSDLWMYLLYHKGEIVDSFNPVPDYWNADIPAEEINSWKGNAEVVAKYVPGLQAHQIENYLRRWEFETAGTLKAYDDDKFANEDWQFLDFMRKLGLPCPINEKGEALGQAYKLLATPPPWQGKPMNFDKLNELAKARRQEKPWWKFW